MPTKAILISNGKIVEMQAYFDTKSLENELAAQEEME